MSAPQTEQAAMPQIVPEATPPLVRIKRKMSRLGRLLLGNTIVEEADRLQQKEFEEILSILRAEKLKRSKWRLRCIKYSLLYTILACALRKFAHIGYFANHWDIFLIVMYSGVVISQQAKSAAVAIARFDDVRAVGPLAEALWFKDKYVTSAASTALIRLLPRLQASDACLLSPRQRSCLNKALRERNPSLTLAILKAWEQVGDSAAIADVESIAEGRGEGGQFPKVVRAAKDCLPFLRQSAERVQAASQLLRPANDSSVPSDNLLRPVLPHTSPEPSEQLLRPTDAA